MPNLYLYNKIIPVAEKKRRQYTRYCSLKWKKCKAIRPKVIKKRARRSASIKSNCSRGGWKSQFRPTFPRWRKNLLLGNGDSRKKKKKKEEVDWPVTGSMARTGLHTRGARIAAGPSGSPTAHRRAITSHRGPAITNGDLSLSISLVKPPPSHPPPPPLFNPPPSRFQPPSSLSAYPTA